MEWCFFRKVSGQLRRRLFRNVCEVFYPGKGTATGIRLFSVFLEQHLLVQRKLTHTLPYTSTHGYNSFNRIRRILLCNEFTAIFCMAVHRKHSSTLLSRTNYQYAVQQAFSKVDTYAAANQIKMNHAITHD